MELIIGRIGEQPFAITDKSVSGKHLKLTTLPDGNVQVEDLGSSNGTFIDGVRIIKKVVNRNTVIQLGSHYSFKVCDVLPETPKADRVHPQTPNATSTPKTMPEYSIRPLKKIWEEFERTKEELDEKNKNIQLWRSAAPIFTMGSGALGVIFPYAFILTFIGLGLTIYAFYMAKNFDYKKSINEAQDKFENMYLCPNCNHFLENRKYKLLVQDKKCRYCGCKFKE